MVSEIRLPRCKDQSFVPISGKENSGPNAIIKQVLSLDIRDKKIEFEASEAKSYNRYFKVCIYNKFLIKKIFKFLVKSLNAWLRKQTKSIRDRQ